LSFVERTCTTTPNAWPAKSDAIQQIVRRLQSAKKPA